jgi:hypothetical protein
MNCGWGEISIRRLPTDAAAGAQHGKYLGASGACTAACSCPSPSSLHAMRPKTEVTFALWLGPSCTPVISSKPKLWVSDLGLRSGTRSRRLSRMANTGGRSSPIRLFAATKPATSPAFGSNR